jgi:hypothetical protein
LAVVRYEQSHDAQEFWDTVDAEAIGRVYVGRWTWLGARWVQQYERDEVDTLLWSAAQAGCDDLNDWAETQHSGPPWTYAGVWVLHYPIEFAGDVKSERWWVLLCSIPNIPYGMLA